MDEKNYIVKANKLIEAKGRLSTIEQKLLATVISEIKMDDIDFKEYRLGIKEISEFINLSSNAVYEQIKIASRNLRRKEIVIETVNSNGNKSFLVTGLLSSAMYQKGEGYIRVSIDPNLKPYLLAINGKETPFTKYMIKNILRLNSSYSIRLYEILKQYEKRKKRIFEISEIKNFLGIEAKSYKLFAEFERRVLKPAKAEIDKKTDIYINYKKIKEGRKITKIEFTINPKLTQESEQIRIIDELYSDEQIEDIKNKSGIQNEKFTKTQTIKLYEIACDKVLKYELDPFKYIELNYRYCLSQKIDKSMLGYFTKALKEDYANAIMCMRLLVPNVTTI